MNAVKIKAPATIANLVCGFDVLGLCVTDPYDEMEISLLSKKEVIIRSGNGYPLPTDPSQNTAGAPLVEMLKEVHEEVGFEVTIYKNIKPGSGIGSSAASAAGAVVGANFLLQNRFSKNDLVRFALYGEKVASGVKHADNIAPCIFGGVTLIRSIFPLDIIPLSAPRMYISLVHPQIEIKTADARQILRKDVLLGNPEDVKAPPPPPTRSSPGTVRWSRARRSTATPATRRRPRPHSDPVRRRRQ